MATDTSIDSSEKTEDKDKKPAASSEDIKSSCDISLNQIIIALHFNALKKIGNDNIKIQNSAIDGDKEENAKFYGAGQHIIAAIPLKSGSLDETGIAKKDALQPLQTYIQWFAGPDIKLSEDQLNALDMSSDDKEKADDIEASKKDKVAGEKYEESNIYVPSFSQYLLLEDGEEAEASTDAEAKPEEGTEDKPEASGNEEKAKGWYITFNLDIKGQKTHPLADALKKFGKDLLEGFGVSTFDWRSGATGEVKTIGDMLDSLDAVFGKIDPDELIKKYDDNLKKKFPQGEARSQIWDTKTINQHLKKQLDSKAKSKLKEAELALCTRVDKRDKSYKMYNSQLIADTVTASIQGLFKKFKNKIDKKDVIMVNNYSDDKKDKEEKQYTGDKAEGAVADSLQNTYNGMLLTEDENKKLTVGQASTELQKIVQSDLKDYKATSQVASSEKIVDKLTKAGIDEPRLFEELKKAKYSFLIKTTEPVESETKIENASNRVQYNLLTQLFEKQLTTKGKDTTIIDKVKKVFDKFVIGLKEYSPTKDIKKDAIDALVGHVSDKEVKEESLLHKTASYMKLLYEDFDLSDLLSEKNHKKLDDKKWNSFKKLVKANLKDIRDNKDKIIKQSYEDQGQMLAFTKGDEAKNNGYDDFIYALFDDNADVESTLKKLTKITHRENFRNDIVYRFKYAPEDNEDKDTKIEITFIDKDPNEQKEDKEIAKITKEEGKELELPEPPKHGGWEFKGWDPDPNEMEESGETYSTYEEQTNAEEDDVEITYMDIEDPSKQDDEKQYEEFKKITKNPDGSIESPKPPAKEGYDFEKWDPDPDEMSKSGQTFAKYVESKAKARFIFKAPKDPSKPDDDLIDVAEPIEYEDGKDITPPDAPEYKGYEFEKWMPDPKTVKDPEGDVEIIATYKEAADGKETGKTQDVYYVIPDENGILNPTQYSIVFVTTDADKPDDRSQWKEFGETQTIDDPKSIKYPKDEPNAVDGHKFIGWSPSEEEFKKNSIDKYYSNENFTREDKDGNKQIVIKAIYEKDQFKIRIVNPDPEDPENTKTQKDVATITVIQVDGKKYYKAEDLRKLAKETQSKEEADKYNKIADDNEQAFKSVDNLKGYDNKPYQLLKKEPWNPPLEQAVENPDSKDEVVVKAQYENAVKTKHTELDFYIVPMKGLSYNTRKRQKEESK